MILLLLAVRAEWGFKWQGSMQSDSCRLPMYANRGCLEPSKWTGGAVRLNPFSPLREANRGERRSQFLADGSDANSLSD